MKEIRVILHNANGHDVTTSYLPHKFADAFEHAAQLAEQGKSFTVTNVPN